MVCIMHVKYKEVGAKAVECSSSSIGSGFPFNQCIAIKKEMKCLQRGKVVAGGQVTQKIILGCQEDVMCENVLPCFRVL